MATPVFPGGLVGAAQLPPAHEGVDAASVLASGIDDDDVSLSVASGEGSRFGTSGRLTIDEEHILYADRTGDTLSSLTRGALGSTPAAHSAGAIVISAPIAVEDNQVKAEVIAIEGKLGVNPQGGHSTVVDRLDAVDTSLASKLAASAYTAADVLAKLLDVDGASSGVDSDLLDGQHGSYYLALANMTGLGANVATFLATPSSANLRAALTDESGSGVAIFATLTSIASGEILKWSGSNWINQTLAEAGIAAASHVHSAADVTSGTLALARGGTGASLSNPGADRIAFWDNGAGAITWLAPGTGIEISGTTLQVKSTTASAAATLSAGASVNLAMDEYSFFPSIGSTTGETLRILSWTSDGGDTVGRIRIFNNAATSENYTARWRYLS